MTGFLALSSRPAIDGQVATIAVFSHDHEGPMLHKDPNAEFFDCCTYDPHGNLYGYGGVSDDKLVIAELPAHSRKFINIPLGNNIDDIEGLQWAGKYLTVGNESQIEQFSISRHTASLAGTVSLSRVSYLQRYVIDRNRIIVANTQIQGQGYVNLYDYPKGGSPLGRREFEQPVAVAVSRAVH
jgi:hypothetical protein